MRKAKIILAVALAVVLAILAAAWLLFDANRFRGQLQTRLEQQLHRKVVLGDMRLGLFPIRLTVEKLEIAEDARFKSQFPFTQTQKLDVRVGLAGLLGGNVQVDSIELVQPQVELIRNAAGVWNFSSLSATEAAPATPDSKKTTPAEGKSSFSLKRLNINGGKIAITDAFRKKPRTVYGPIDISLTDYKAGQPFGFDVSARLPGSGSQSIHLKGNGGPLPESGPATLPLKATVSLDGVDIAGLRQFLDSGAVSTAQGSLSGETQIDSQSGKLSANGKLELKSAKVGGVDVGYPIAFDYKVSSDLEKGLLQITSATLKLGPTPLSLTGTVNTNPNPMEVDLRLKTGEAAITEIARLASAFGIAFSPDTAVAGRVSGDVRVRGAIDRLALDGSIAARDLQISGKTVPQPVHVRAIDLALTPAEIQSNEFQATSGQTTVLGRFAVRQYSSKTPTMDLALKAPGASLKEMQAIAKAYGVKGLDQLSGDGKLTFDLRAVGPLESVASADIAKTLNGTMDLDFNTVRIQGFDASRELARIGGFLKSDQKDKGFTEVIRLAGHINVKDGIAETTDLQAQLLDGSLATTGSSDLSSQTLNLKAMAAFSKAFSDKVGGSTRVGGFLTTALSNDKGEIIIPVLISGNMAKPGFAPDAKTFLQLQKQRIVPGLLDALTGKKAPAEPGKEEPKPNNLKGVLNGIFGGKK
jgi:AsmA protein